MSRRQVFLSAQVELADMTDADEDVQVTCQGRKGVREERVLFLIGRMLGWGANE